MRLKRSCIYIDTQENDVVQNFNFQALGTDTDLTTIYIIKQKAM